MTHKEHDKLCTRPKFYFDNRLFRKEFMSLSLDNEINFTMTWLKTPQSLKTQQE